jgi:hypothetical protein
VNPFFIDKKKNTVTHYNAVIVKLKDAQSKTFIDKIGKRENAIVIQKPLLGENSYIIYFNENIQERIFGLTNELNNQQGIDYAEIDFITLVEKHSNYENLQWALNNNGSNYPGGVPSNGIASADMKVIDAWDIENGSSNIKVAVLDNGIQLNHSDLDDNLLAGYDAIPLLGSGTSGGYTGSDSHGTSCAGIVAAEDNGVGITGICPSCKIIPIRVIKDVNDYTVGNVFSYILTSWVAQGINWAYQNGADILSNSYGGGNSSNPINNAISNAVQNGRNGKGCILLFSSGNNNRYGVLYPSLNNNVISVGATSMCDTRKRSSSNARQVNPDNFPDPNGVSCDGEYWWGSNFGTGLDVSAPGVKIYSTTIGSAYTPDFNGTSSACPNAAGVMALILSVNPNLTIDEARETLETTCDKVGGYSYYNKSGQPNGTWSDDLGYGRVNAYRAVHKAAYDIRLNSPISITPTNINQCSEITVSTSIRNNGVKTWRGKIYISLHKNNDDFIRDLTVASNIIIPPASNTQVSVTELLNTIPEIQSGNVYKIYVKYQTDGTPYPNEYPHVGRGNFINPTFMPVNHAANCDNLPIPPGNYKSVLLSGLNFNQQTNELEFLFQGIPAQQGDPVIDVVQKVEGIKKRFKQALAVPESNQWISLNINQSFIGDATTGANFQNTDLAKDFFEADVNLKFSSVFKPVTGFSPYTGTFTDWNNLILQGPDLSELQNSPLFYPHWGVYAGIHSYNMNYSIQGATKILINNAQMEMHKGILWTELDNSVNNLPSHLRNTLLSKIPAYRNTLTQKLTTGVNITTPLVNVNGAAFQQLRESYRITAAAHWYKTLSNYQNKPFHSLINSNNLTGIMVSPPYNDAYWDGQALQPLPHSVETYNYYNNQGSGSYSCVGGLSMGNYDLINDGVLNNDQIQIDTVCFKNRSYIFQDSTVYFYGGVLDYPSPDLTGIIQPQTTNHILGDTLTVSATIYNFGNKNAQQFPVRLYKEYINAQNQIQHILIGQQIISNLDSFSVHTLTFNWTPLTHGNKKLRLTIDEGNSIIEKKEDNNIAYDSLFIQNDIPTVIITSPASGSAVAKNNISFTGTAYDNLDGYLPSNSLTWTSDIDGFLGSGNYIHVDSLSVGNHTITFTGTNSIGKTAFDYINLYVFPQGYPVVAINTPVNNETLPDNAHILFSGNAFDIDEGSLCGNATWTSSIDGILGTGCNISRQLSLGNHTITFTAQNSAGNIASATRQITVVDGLPQITIISPSSNTSIFQHQQILLQANATDFPQGNISSQVNWYSNLQGHLGIGQNISTTLIPGIQTITASVQDNAGSVATATVNSVIINYTPPVPVILQPQNGQSFIYQDTITFIGNAVDIQDGNLHGNSLKWYSSINGFIGIGDTLNTNTLSYGTHTISLKATDSDNTDSTVSVTNIFIDAGQPSVNITAPADGANFFFRNSITFAGNATDPQDEQIPTGSLSWYSDADGYLGSGSSITTNTLSAGNQTITLEATDSNGFIGSASIGIFIESPHPPSVSIYYPANNSTFINGSAITLKAFANDYEEGVLPDHRISWASSVNGNLGTGKTIITSNLSPGNHTIITTAIDTTGLTATASVQIVIEQQKPVATIISPSSGDVFSLGTTIAFTGSATDFEDGVLSGNSLQWISSVNGSIGSGNSIAANSLSTGSHFIYLVATDSEGAKDTATIVLIIQAPHTVLLTKFASNADSAVVTFGENGGNTIVSFNIPKHAELINAQISVEGHSYQQSPNWLWAKSIGGNGDDYGISITTDISGYTYLSGYFRSKTLTLDGITLTNADTSGATYDIFIAKFDASGNIIWAKREGGVTNDWVGKIHTDQNGNLYMVGRFTSPSIMFGGTTLTYSGTNNPNYFITKYNSAGNVIWAQSVGNAFAHVQGIAVDTNGNIYVAGDFFSPTVTFGGITLTNTSAGNYDIFLVKYNASGNVLWAKSVVGGQIDYAYDLTVDTSGDVIITGTFTSNSLTFGTITLTNTGSNDAYVVKYNSLGNVVWAKNAIGSSQDYGNGVSTDSNNNIYLTGLFSSSSITFDGIALTNSGNWDLFIVKLDPIGNVIWAKKAGGTSGDYGNGIATKQNGDNFTIGNFASQTLSFGNYTLSRISSDDIFVVKHSDLGDPSWAAIAGGANSDRGRSISTDNYGDVYIAGDYNSPQCTFGQSQINNYGGNDAFIAKLRGYSPSFPYNPNIDVLNDGFVEWNFSGSFQNSIMSNNFSAQINNYLDTVSNQLSQVSIPIMIHSDSAGIIKLKHLNIQYLTTDTIKPSFISARTVPNSLALNSNFSVRVKVTDNEKVQEVTANFNNVNYVLTEVSPDSFQVSINANAVGVLPVVITVADTNGLSRDTTLFVTVYTPTRDLEITDNNIAVQPAVIFTDDTVNLNATVKNNSNILISNAQVALIIDGVIRETKTVNIGALSQSVVNFSWITEWGQNNIEVKADPNNLIAEANEGNNSGFKQITVNDPYPPVIIQATATPNPAYINEQVLFKVKALDSTGIASVAVNWLGQNVTLQYNVSTEFYEGLLIANTVGTANALITVYDQNNLTSSVQLSIQVINNLPDLKIYSSDIQFIPPTAAEGENMSIQVKVKNTGNINVNNAGVSLSVNGTFIGNTSVSISADSFSVVTFNWIAECGNKTFTAIADSANLIAETNENNNSAAKNYQVCSGSSYQLTVTANPSILTLGNSVSIEAVSVPNIVNASVFASWNGQNQNMPYDNNANAYLTSITPSQTGTFIVPVFFTDSGNNTANGFAQFTVTDNLPELSVNTITANFPVQPYINTAFSITVSNNSLIAVSNPLVHLVVNGQVVDSVHLNSLNGLDTAVVNLNWTAQSGSYVVTAIIDPHNQIAENNETNNSKSIQLNIQDNQPPVIHYVITNSPTYQGGTATIESYVTDNDSVISVIATYQGSDYPLQYDTVSLTWKTTLNTPSNGMFNIGITATDNFALTSYASTQIIVNDNLPDLEVKAQDIVFVHVDSVTNTLSAIIRNNGGSSVTGATVHFLLNGILIDSSSVNLSAGQIDTVVFTFNHPVGFYTATITVDPHNQITESEESNNSASRNIFIPDLIPPAAPVVTVNPSSWSASPSFSVSWNQVFDNSGIVTYEYSINGSTWIDVGGSLSANVTVSIEGISYVYVRAKDAFGNLSEPDIGEMRYDNTPPNAPLIAEYHCGEICTTHDSPYLEWLNPGDVGSGIEYFEVSIDNQITNIGFNLIHHPTLTTGIHTIKVRAIDYVGNTGSWSNEIIVYIDLDNPDCPVIQSPTHPDQNQWYQNDSLVLNWIRPAETSAVTGYFYMLNHDSAYYADQTSYWLGVDSLTIIALPAMDTSKIRLPDGIWYVHLTSQDSVGHLSSASCSYKFMLDKTPPFTTSSNLDTVTVCNYTFSLQAEDYHSGVQETKYRINGSAWVTDTNVIVNNIGLNVIEFYSIDHAGNTEQIQTTNVFVISEFVSGLGNDTTVCGSITLTASNAVSYNWSNGATSQSIIIDSSDVLILEITDSLGCKVTDTIAISVNALPVAYFSYTQSEYTVTFNNESTSSSSYSWSFGDSNSSSQTNPIHTYNDNGIYVVTLTATNDSCGSVSYSDSVSISGVVSVIDDTGNGSNILVFPNPTKKTTVLKTNDRK